MKATAQKYFAEDLRNLRSDSALEEYGRFQQHLVLLEDELRLYTFAQAIGMTAPKEYVVDVGAGTGVLSIMALRAGYEHAIMVEPSKKMCRYIQHMLEINGLENRATIINSTLEALDFSQLPKQVGLIVTETISTVIAGFGSWDYIPKLAERLEPDGRMIPESGSVHGYLCTRPQSYKHDFNGGLRLLSNLGIKTDLFQQAFRSYGNIFDKEHAQSNGAEVFELVRFDVNNDPAMQLLCPEVIVHETASYCGITTYFNIVLDSGNNIGFSSMDKGLSAWYPYYIPFSEPIKLVAGERLPVELVLHDLDAPYTYAFQLMSGTRPLTRIMYW